MGTAVYFSTKVWHLEAQTHINISRLRDEYRVKGVPRETRPWNILVATTISL